MVHFPVLCLIAISYHVLIYFPMNTSKGDSLWYQVRLRHKATTWRPSSHSSPFKSVGFSYKHQPAAWTMLDHVGCQTYRQPSSRSASSSIRFQDGSQTVRNIYGIIWQYYYTKDILSTIHICFSYTIYQFWRTNSIDYGNPMVSSAKPG